MFTNNQVEIDSLPRFNDLQFTAVDRRYFTVICINLIIAYLSICGFLVFIKTVSNKDGYHNRFWYIIAVVAVLFLIQFIIYKLGFNKRKYALRDKDILYSEGLVVNTTKVLPFSRVQHIEIKRSFISRKFNLSTLKIYSAGESGGDMSIKGLPKDVAENIYAFLTNIVNERL